MMDLPKPTFAVTPYGDVDAAQLATLRQGYETAALLKLVEQLDRLRPRLAAGAGIRDDLLRLHRMAHCIINGGPLSEPIGDTDLWECAVALADEFKHLASTFDAIAQQLQPLSQLRPSYES
ncbi:Tn3 family transposase post-transcriptional regulator TnpC [Chitinolyticbacter albus]|uniref:Tn3 family transposase post-transcriptional regulator TnpC n=1 Tax=Chitinolyticbacter albus TaxID=2961951 RepID=UPI0027E3B34A|nr:Tn3 family transposase post-transcriptional regulator TnpC [Chitinolyticbacter albus]